MLITLFALLFVFLFWVLLVGYVACSFFGLLIYVVRVIVLLAVSYFLLLLLMKPSCFVPVRFFYFGMVLGLFMFIGFVGFCCFFLSLFIGFCVVCYLLVYSSFYGLVDVWCAVFVCLGGFFCFILCFVVGASWFFCLACLLYVLKF